MQPQTGQVDEPRDFASILLDLARGRTVGELSTELHGLIRKCQDTGKKGILTLTLELIPVPGDTKQLVMRDQIKVKAPEHDRAPTNFYLDKNGRPQKDDPEQASLFDGVERRPAPEGPTRATVINLDGGRVNTTTGEVID